MEQWLCIYSISNARNLTATVLLTQVLPTLPWNPQQLTLTAECEQNWGKQKGREGVRLLYLVDPYSFASKDEEPCAASDNRLFLGSFPRLIWNSCQNPAVCRPQAENP